MSCNFASSPPTEHESTYTLLKFILSFLQRFFEFLNITSSAKYSDSLTLKVEKRMAVHSSICVWQISWTEKPRGLHVVHEVMKESDMTE